MPESKQPLPNEDRVRFDSDNCDLLEIKEEDTVPGKLGEGYRRLLEKKYGRKVPPDPPDPPNVPDGPNSPAQP